MVTRTKQFKMPESDSDSDFRTVFQLLCKGGELGVVVFDIWNVNYLGYGEHWKVFTVVLYSNAELGGDNDDARLYRNYAVESTTF